MASDPGHPVSTDPLAALAATTAVRRLRLLADLEIERYAPLLPPPVRLLEPAAVLRERRRILNEALDGSDG